MPRPVCGASGCSADSTLCRTSTFRDSIRDKEQARRRLAFDELLRVQLVLVLRKRAMERDQRGIAHDLRGDLVQRFHDALPYPLTGAQRARDRRDRADLGAPHPMHRLLQGDVGSGKTVVAVDTMMVAVQGATRRR